MEGLLKCGCLMIVFLDRTNNMPRNTKTKLGIVQN